MLAKMIANSPSGFPSTAPLGVTARMRTDLRLALLTLFSVITIVVVVPIAIVRFMRGEVLTGFIDLAIVLSILLTSAYAWRSGNLDRAGLIVIVTNTAGCTGVAVLAGLPGLLWIYPVILSNFLLVGRISALWVSAFGTLAVAAVLSSSTLADPVHMVVFVVTAVVLSLFAYVFASRADLQRQQLEAIAVNDPLTGAYNRRGLEVELAIAMASSTRNRTNLTLAVFDLDHFKQINDDFGHDAGDLVLVQFADVVRASIRHSDRFFRLGGEEFALLVPGADLNALRQITEKLRAATEQQIRCGDRQVTVSIGASLLQCGEAASDWLQRTDAAMYRAKHAGRNQVVIDEAPAGNSMAPLSADEGATTSIPAGFAGE